MTEARGKPRFAGPTPLPVYEFENWEKLVFFCLGLLATHGYLTKAEAGKASRRVYRAIDKETVAEAQAG